MIDDLEFTRDVTPKTAWLEEAGPGRPPGAGRIKAEPVRVHPGMTVADGFQAVVAACIRHFRLNEPLLIDQRSAPALHQSRVAMRRLRAALSLFRPAIADEQYDRIRDELRWFSGELGDARNLDVLLMRDLPPAERQALEEKRECAYDSAIAAVESQRFRMLMLNLGSWTANGDWRQNRKARKPLAAFVSPRLDRLWAKVRDARRLRAMSGDQLHRFRIRVKKLRYALEFVAALHDHPKRHENFAKEIEEIQDALGYFHDVVVVRMLGLLLDDAKTGDTEERNHLRDAKRSLRRLRKLGPYWRRPAAAQSSG